IVLLHQVSGSAEKIWLTIGPSTIKPMKPQTMDGMAASNSMMILSDSFTLPFANSEMYTAAPSPTGTAMMRAMKVVTNVPTINATAPQLGSLPGGGLGIQRELVKKRTQSSVGTIGAASLKINPKMAAMPMMLLQPLSRMSHSVGFSIASKKLNLFRDFV